MRPTPLAALAALLCAPLALILAGIAPFLWEAGFAFPALAVAAFLLDTALCPPWRALRVDAQTPARLAVGATGAMTVTLSAPSTRLPVTLHIVADQSGPLAPPEVFACSIPPGGTAILHLPLRPTRRGRIHIETILVRWTGPFALNRRDAALVVNRDIDVTPDITSVQRAALQFFDRDALVGLKMQRERGESTEFDALRDYAQGMDIRTIDWKHSAHHAKLVAKEFRIERNHPVILAFDTGHLMRDPIDGIPRLDHAIHAGLLLGYTALRTGDLVGTYAFDSAIRHYGPPLRGTAAFNRLQSRAAGLDYTHEETNFTLGIAELSVRLKRRALVVLFTDFTDTVAAELMVESLQRLAARHVVIFVCQRDPALTALIDRRPDHSRALAEAVIARDLVQERRAILARLERLGINCLDVPKTAVPISLVNRYVLIKQRALL
jgi:uncharacterized protein (DUF58 family)